MVGRKVTVSFLVLSLTIFPYIGMAGGNDRCFQNGSETWKKVKGTLFHEDRINSICSSPIKGVYEVVVNDKQLIYVDPVSQTIIVGVLIKDRVNLTEKRYKEIFGVQEMDDERKRDFQKDSLEDKVIPPYGIIIPVKWGNLGRRMVEAGVIDPQRMETPLSKRGGLGKEAKKLLMDRNNGKIIINLKNARFLLNLFWALGLSNKNETLEGGPMANPRYGNPGRFASTGGWILAEGNAMEHYSKHSFILLNQEQQRLVDRVSKNIYRPCCNNSTYFPDCNHGMAMLGLLELMASQGHNEETMYRVALQVNSYWFPNTYLTIARLFEKNGIEWEKIDPKEVLSYRYSSGSGYREVLKEVQPSKVRGGESCGF